MRRGALSDIIIPRYVLPPLAGSDEPGLGFDDLTGDTLTAVEVMIREYVSRACTGTNTRGERVEASVSAIMRARNELRGIIPVDTRDSEGNALPEGNAFGLAALWFRRAVTAADQVWEARFQPGWDPATGEVPENLIRDSEMIALLDALSVQ